MADLKPCPFCGNASGVVFIETQGTKWGSATCPECCAYGPEVRTGYKKATGKNGWGDRAIAAWNRRASGWLSVEERLPEDGESSPRWMYLCINSVVGLPFFADYIPGRGWKTDRVVTHWQPILAPPEAP
jgi:hypothetical protein